MEIVAPNVKELLTAAVGARIISKAGSLARLGRLPASTIQILGAEKALFRALKIVPTRRNTGYCFSILLFILRPRVGARYDSKSSCVQGRNSCHGSIITATTARTVPFMLS